MTDPGQSNVGRIAVSGLRVVDRTGRQIIDDVSFTVEPGTTLGIVGESGSGKTTLLRALVGAVHPDLTVAGAVHIGYTNMITAPARRVRAMQRTTLAYLSQNPASALTPTMRSGELVAERMHRPTAAAIAAAMAAVQLPDDVAFQRRYPHQLSGGQQQRLALARTLANNPTVLLLDEPTTALDVTTQELVLDEIIRQQLQQRRTIVVVSHDLTVIARLADTIIVLKNGHVVEHGRLTEVISRPNSAYTAELIAANPQISDYRHRSLHRMSTGIHHETPAIRVDGLRASYQQRKHRDPVVAADDVSFHIHHGECVALVGESGSGKSTIARCLAGTHLPDAGAVRCNGAVVAAASHHRALLERKGIQLIPQDPWSSLNPRRTVVDAVARAAHCYQQLDRGDARAVALALLDRVGISPRLLDRRPQQLSGGERQRTAIARALAAEPDILICDEITSALDVSVQASVLELLAGLRRDTGLAMLFITHDLGVVARIADRVLVLEQGRVCEHGSLAEVFDDPSHQITRRLIGATRSLNDTVDARTRPQHNNQAHQVSMAGSSPTVARRISIGGFVIGGTFSQQPSQAPGDERPG